MENRLARNRKSPSNEDKYIAAYQSMNPSSKSHDGYDIAAVTAVNGEKGHAMVPESINRSHDHDNHRVKNFISDAALKQQMKK